MMTAETAKRIVTALLPDGAVLKATTRGGIRCQVVVKDEEDLFAAQTIVELANLMETEARKQPMTFNHEDTHLWNRPARIEPDYNGNRGDFFLIGSDGFRVHLHWVDYGRRWIASFQGKKLVYKREFKMSFTEEERNYPALKAWLAF